ncbi:trafficking protein particle complex subunit 12-like [Lingula anatina]|uniref:Trafficking protein particle complex subunit 12-like n=1 Tax=Lingula anatina TaxID=7574 RepID=A0A1S3HQJ4_LINAN|nr:trafficking protein particle complex subunit 12-like [Lingula anatina]|eukprot:XP_013387811.1 trafficking protein particle complex subunit 12-like [Lingula anatina]
MEEAGEESASAAMEPVSDNPDIHAELPASTETVEVNPMARTSSTESSHTTTGNLDSVDLLSPDVEEVDILGSGVEEGDHKSMKMKEEMLSEQVGQELDTANDGPLSGKSALAQSMEELSLDQSAVEPEPELTEDQTAGTEISENDKDSAPSLAQYFAHSQDNSGAEFFDSLPPTSADDSGFIPDTSEKTQVENGGEDTANTGKLESRVGKREQVLTEIGALKEATHEEKPKVDQEIRGVPLPAVPQSTSVAATTATEITVDTSTTTTPTTTTTQFPLPTTPPLPQFEQTTPPLPMAAPTDDMFSVGMDNVDRSYDAWIPSEATRQVLIAKVTSAPGTFFPSAEQLTCPGLLYDDLQGDPVKDLVYRYMGDVEASKRQTLTADSVPPNDEGLRQLIKAECHRAAIDLTGKILREHGQGMGSAGQISNNTPWSLQIWFTRIALMMKLKMYSLVESELQAFGTLDKPDLYYNYYPDVYKGRKVFL